MKKENGLSASEFEKLKLNQLCNTVESRSLYVQKYQDTIRKIINYMIQYKMLNSDGSLKAEFLDKMIAAALYSEAYHLLSKTLDPDIDTSGLGAFALTLSFFRYSSYAANLSDENKDNISDVANYFAKATSYLSSDDKDSVNENIQKNILDQVLDKASQNLFSAFDEELSLEKAENIIPFALSALFDDERNSLKTVVGFQNIEADSYLNSELSSLVTLSRNLQCIFSSHYAENVLAFVKADDDLDPGNLPKVNSNGKDTASIINPSAGSLTSIIIVSVFVLIAGGSLIYARRKDKNTRK